MKYLIGFFAPLLIMSLMVGLICGLFFWALRLSFDVRMWIAISLMFGIPFGIVGLFVALDE